MAQESPSSVDVQEIQFKLHDKFNVFPFGNELRSHVNLLAVASSQGQLFVGNPHAAEMKVFILKDLVDAKTTGHKLAARSVTLSDVPNSIAVSADGAMLAVNCTQNGMDTLQIYSVVSFLTVNPKLLYNLRLSPEENVTVVQLLWNPVLTTSLAVVLSNGALAMYSLKDGGNFEFHTLDKQNQVKCGCWSPKGKQIVLGFPNGKLQQFKPDLTPAKNIICPMGIHPGPFDVIAIHWLSTFQFAAVFLQHGENMSPSLYVVNAPKGGQPSYINYYDICYSATGPRQHQINFTHVQQWNLLLVTSANGVELGILGTKETGESPTWVQYTLLDEARIEMPLTDNKDETYPIGFAYDTASTHHVIIGEQKIPVMPMVHVLSTHGHLVSFNFLNLTPGAPDVCSPPPPIIDASGQFRPIDEQLVARYAGGEGGDFSNSAVAVTPTPSQEMSFTFNPSTATSTPALKEKPKPFFGGTTDAQSGSIFGSKSTTFAVPQSVGITTASGTGFGSFMAPTKPQASSATSVPTVTPTFGGIVGTTSGFTGFEAKNVEPHKESSQAAQKQSEMNKPLYTVPPTFTPTTAAATTQSQQKSFNEQSTVKTQISSNEVDDIVKQMIAIQINSFDLELKQLGNQSKDLLANIGKPDEMKSCTKRLNDLQEIIEQANDRDFEFDVQHLRHSLNESYAMLAECRTKLDMYSNPDLTRLTCISTFDPINRRQLAKLQSYVATNQAQLQQLQQQIDAQWASYQDLVRRNSKTQMHIPCLDGIYQRMTKLKDMMGRQRTKLNYVKSKLKQKGLIFKPLNDLDTIIAEKPVTMESLADSILSMSLANAVDANHSKLSAEKLNAIRCFVRDRRILHIRPQRPDRIGLKSEVILETKLQTERQSRNGAVTRLSKMQQEKVPTLSNAPAALISKPTPTKPTTSKSNFVPPGVSQAPTSPNFGFGGTNSLFVKTSSAAPAAAIKSEDSIKSFTSIHGGGTSVSQSSFLTPSFTGLGGSNVSNQPLNFGQTKPAFTARTELSNEVFAVTSAAPQAPISFAAKVVTSETSKPATSSTSSFLPTKLPQDKENKKPPETEIPKTFSFGGGVKEGTALFGVGGDSKTAFGVAPTSSAGNVTLFGGNANKASTFDGKTGSNTFSFGGIGATIGTAPSSMSFNSTVTTSAMSFGGAGDAKLAPLIAETASNTASATPDSNTFIAKSPVFSGSGKSVGESIASTTSSSFGALNLSTAVATTTTSSNAKTTSASTVESSAFESTTNYAATASDFAADSLLGSLDACKPTSKEADAIKTTNAGNVFSGFGGGGSSSFSFATAASDTTKPFFGGTTSVGSVTFSATPATPASLSNSTTETTISNVQSGSDVKPVVLSTPTPFSFSFGGTTTAISTATTTTTVAGSTAAVASNTSTSPFFSAAISSAPSIFATIAPTSTTSSSIFGGNTSSFLGTSTASTPIVSTAPSIFAAAASATPVVSSTAAPSSIFGTAAVTTTTSPSMFGTTLTATSNSSNVFGGIPKPDQSVFGSPPANAQPATGGGIFAAAAAANPSPFSSPPGGASGGSIFGGGGVATGFGAPSATGGSSIFGGGSANSSPFGAPTANTGSIFGGAAKPVEGANIFGSPTQPSAATAGGSIFGQIAFNQPAAQSTGSMFGAGGATAQQPSTGFGGGSIFGGGTAAASNAPGSIFGGTTSAFGSNSPNFGSFSQQAATPAFNSSTAGAGSFAQGGASVAQSGFGSPAQSSAFSTPVFGGAVTFGSPPAFGAQPSFGGAATFGSPKGFGSFASPTAAAAPAAGGFATQTQKNNLFEALGSTETELSFGNLAQNTNVNVPKPTFGGSSFMNYRA